MPRPLAWHGSNVLPNKSSFHAFTGAMFDVIEHRVTVCPTTAFGSLFCKHTSLWGLFLHSALPWCLHKNTVKQFFYYIFIAVSFQNVQSKLPRDFHSQQASVIRSTNIYSVFALACQKLFYFEYCSRYDWKGWYQISWNPLGKMENVWTKYLGCEKC